MCGRCRCGWGLGIARAGRGYGPSRDRAGSRRGSCFMCWSGRENSAGVEPSPSSPRRYGAACRDRAPLRRPAARPPTCVQTPASRSIRPFRRRAPRRAYPFRAHARRCDRARRSRCHVGDLPRFCCGERGRAIPHCARVRLPARAKDRKVIAQLRRRRLGPLQERVRRCAGRLRKQAAAPRAGCRRSGLDSVGRCRPPAPQRGRAFAAERRRR